MKRYWLTLNTYKNLIPNKILKNNKNNKCNKLMEKKKK